MKKVILVFIVVFFFSIISANNPIKRIEPAFWWTGMKNPQVQLLIYGEKISEYDVFTKKEGVKITALIKTENPNYLFVDILISPETKAGTIELNFSRDKKIEFTHKYQLLDRRTKSADRIGVNNEDVIYLIMPDRFANGNPDNDNSSEMIEKVNRNDLRGRHGGDLLGIEQHFDYLKELGVTTLWLNPVLEGNLEQFSYHHYAISDFYKVDPRFGTNEEYKDFVEHSHKNGFKIIKDMIFNHCASTYWWMKDLPSQDWINQHKEYTRSSFNSYAIYDPYKSQYDYDRTCNGWFDVTMADLNQKNALLSKYLIQNSIWWIEYADLDGIRMDTYYYPDKDMMADWNKAVLLEYPNFFIVGELMIEDVASVSYWRQHPSDISSYNSNLLSITDFPLYNAIRSVFSGNGSIKKLYTTLANDRNYYNPEKNMIFASNHDINRLFTVTGENMDNYKMLHTFLFTTRGIPQLYYGDELLFTGDKEKLGDQYVRQDMPGGWIDDNKNVFSKTGRSDKENEAFYFVSNLLKWRKTKSVIHYGKMMHYNPENEVYVYFRYNEKEKVMVLINNNSKTIELKTEQFSEMFGGYTKGNEIITGEKFDNLKNIKIKSKTSMIIELQK